MSEPILSREAIARHAEAAAARFAAAPTGAAEPANPHPIGSDAAAAWKACFERYLLAHTAPEGEASA